MLLVPSYVMVGAPHSVLPEQCGAMLDGLGLTGTSRAYPYPDRCNPCDIDIRVLEHHYFLCSGHFRGHLPRGDVRTTT